MTEHRNQRLQQLADRYTAINMRSRSIRLNRMTKSGAFDLSRLVRTQRRGVWESLAELLGRADEGRVDLVRAKPKDKDGRKLAEHIGTLASSARSDWLETGLRDLAVGWPLLEGTLPDGTWVRAPLILFPCWLEMAGDTIISWQLELLDLPVLNASLAHTIRSRAGIVVDYDAILEGDEDKILAIDEPTWRDLHATLGERLDLLPKPWPGDPVTFDERSEAQRAAQRDLYLQNCAILGRFPPSGSAVVGDYEEMLGGPHDDASLGRAGDLLAVDEVPDVVSPVSLGRLRAAQPVQADPPKADDALAGARRHVALSSDSSQDEVVAWLDGTGTGLVVQGPPGTGKSQMIANVVTAAVAEGMRVLVVCEKRAALDVVAQRLTHAGVGEPLAVVHDASNDRARVCAALARSIDTVQRLIEASPEVDLDGDDDPLARATTRLRLTQEAWTKVTEIPNGRPSLAELYAELRRDPGHDLPDLRQLVGEVGAAEVRAALPALEALSRESEPLALPHPLAHRGDWSQVEAAQLPTIRARFDEVCGIGDRIGALEGGVLTPAEAVERNALWAEASAALDLLDGTRPAELSRFLLFWVWTNGESAHGQWHTVMRVLDAAQKELQPTPHELILEPRATLDAWIRDLQHLEDARVGLARFVRPSWWRLRKLPDAILERCPSLYAERQAPGHKLPVNVARLCRQAIAWQDLIARIPTDNPFLDFGFQGAPSEIADAIEELSAHHGRVRALHALRAALAPVDPVYRELPSFESVSEAADAPFVRAALADRARAQLAEALDEAIAELAFACRAAKAEPVYDGVLAAAFAPIRDRVLAGEYDAAADAQARLRAAWDDVDDAVALDRRARALPPWARRFLRGWRRCDAHTQSTGGDAWLAVQRGWRDHALGGRSRVALEAPLIDAELLDRLAEDMCDAEGHASTRVAADYHDRIVSLAADEAGGLALRQLAAQARKQRRRLTLRQLVERFWHVGLSTVRPVWLCSPDSVAALFPLERAMFDLVIFDEASQCPVEAAVPACLRGARVLVAGDAQQMPPSNFFQASHGVDDDDDGTVLGSTSLLELAEVAWPSMMLQWHYRSHHEALVTFSNRAFYGGGLVTAPRAERALDPALEGLHFAQVEGFWENQTNPVEAAHVVERLHRLLGAETGDGGPPSIGVVAFNLKQAELVQQLINERAAEDAEFRSQLARDRERPPIEQLFVRNLENVQGDERDVIVFTCGYGPSEPGGKVHLRFGPLGLEGGEKRLNVAITRAKLGVHVVASFDPRVLRVDTKHIGPRLFVAYLKFVQAVAAGELQSADAVLDDAEQLGGTAPEAGADRVEGHRAEVWDGIRDEVAAQLEADGYAVVRNHGIGTRRIDIAVGRAADDLRVGIDCSRFLDVARPLVRDVYERGYWQRLGWTIVRVTPGAWAEDRSGVLRAVDAALPRL